MSTQNDLPPPLSDAALASVFGLLKSRTGHDFSQYKPSTVYRRVARRMAERKTSAESCYLQSLEQHPAELDALFHDLLIGVTRFFRDAEAFQHVERAVIPALFAGRSAGTPLRIWTAGCSTGEEAYSLAILLHEHVAAREPATPVQVFATDIDDRAIAVARAGIYPADIASQMTPERLARYFSADPAGGGWRVRRNVRDLLIFSVHNLIRDPPISRLDLISCRNLLIYLNGGLQKRLMPLFSYALKPGGVLWLGKSESVGDAGQWFAPLDRKTTLYQRLPDRAGPAGFAPRRGSSPHRPISHLSAGAAPPAIPPEAAMSPLRQLVEQALLQQIAPTGALVDAQGDIFYLQGRTGMYLEPSPGEAGVNNILKMAREGLQHALSLALSQAVASQQPVSMTDLRVKTNGHHTRVKLRISVLPAAAASSSASSSASASAAAGPCYLVLLEAAPDALPDRPPPADDAPSGAVGDGPQLLALTLALRSSEERLQTSQEELQSTIEELRSANEEMQSVNEELQSTNEELETSREELQAVNEELSGVNAQLRGQLQQLAQSNDDMNNLLAGTGIATVFVDHGLRILRFTPGASEILNLIGGDLGRPLCHLVSNLVGYDALLPDVQAVLASLIPRQREVQTHAGRWYQVRIHPYRTLAHVIEGAVITFIDCTDTVLERQALPLGTQRPLATAQPAAAGDATARRAG